MAENNFKLTRRGALMDERWAIVRISERRRASVLKELRVARPPASLRAVVVVPAAELIRTEGGAATLATHHRPVRRSLHLQPVRARRQQIRTAAHNGALPLPLVRRHRHREVEAVNEADAIRGEVGVAVVEGELGKGGGGGAAESVALEAAAAVAGGAGEAAPGVCAARAGPEAAGPVGGGSGEGAVG